MKAKRDRPSRRGRVLIGGTSHHWCSACFWMGHRKNPFLWGRASEEPCPRCGARTTRDEKVARWSRTVVLYKRRCADLQSRCDRLELEASQDALTGLLTRRRVERAIRREVARTDRYGFPTSVVLVDLDHFKKVNDQNGHLVGDEVLCRMGEAVAEMVRSTDAAGRWGGEEIVVVLGETGEGEAEAFSERLRAAISGLNLGGVRVTASLGVATTRGGEEIPDLLERADKALYAAKLKGRDRVEVG